MKAVSVLLSLAAASVVHAADDAAAGSIRATRKAEVGDVKVQYEAGGKRRERKALTDQHKQMRNDAFDRHLNKKDAPESDVATDKEKETESGDRKLYKAKTGLGKLMQDDDAMRAGKTPINRPGDNWGPEYRDDDDDDRVWGGRPDWGGGNIMGGSSSKSDKPLMSGISSKGDPGWGSSGKPGGWDDWSNDDWMGGSGKSGKGSYGDDWWGGSGKSGKGSGGWGGSGKSGKSTGGGHNGLCQVTVTNLSYKQAFSKMFVMLHEKYVTHYFPMYEFGKNPTDEMCDLTRDLNANGLQAFYAGRPGVDRAWITSNYFNVGGGAVSSSNYLDGGAEFKFYIRPTSDYISLAAGFPFANDGGIVLQAAPIFDGAEYYLPAIDSGCEANLQACWSVPANQDDFLTLAPRSECANDNVSNENDNSFAGENFVSIHRGIQDFDDRNDYDQLTFLECNEVYYKHLAGYFWTEGFDDDLLLCQSVGASGNCQWRDDDDFLRFIKSNNDLVGDDDILVRVAQQSDSYDDFCNRINDINKGLESAFKVLEAFIFDFRNPIARVSIDC